MFDLLTSKTGQLLLQLLAAFNAGKYKTKKQRVAALERFLSMKLLAHIMRAIRDYDFDIGPEDIGMTDARCEELADIADELAVAPPTV